MHLLHSSEEVEQSSWLLLRTEVEKATRRSELSRVSLQRESKSRMWNFFSVCVSLSLSLSLSLSVDVHK
jgi:hypothetical protein